MHVALLFPPAADPRAPHLAIPSLAASLRRAGVRVTARDLDLEGLLALLEPEAMAGAVERCLVNASTSASTTVRERARRALQFADLVADDASLFPAHLRDPDTFFDPWRLEWAREGIARALDIVSAAAGTVTYNIHPIHYDVDGVDDARLADLVAVTADPLANLFNASWRADLLPELAADRPDVVGVSILNSQQVIPGLALARLLKEAGHLVVIGGTLFAKFVDALQARPEFFRTFCHGVVVYEGETALLDLLERVDAGKDLVGVPNMLTLDRRGDVAMGPVHLEDVSALPPPDFDDLPLDLYLAPVPVLPILIGKGCYFNRCKFCDIPYVNKVSDRPYRVRTPEQVAADVAYLSERYGTRFFELTDEALPPALLLRLGDALADYPGLEPRFVGYARLERSLTPATCERLHAMGVRKLFFGLESGSQSTLDHMLKGIRLEDARTVLRNCADAGIAFHIFTIIGFPEETPEAARQTIDFLLGNADVIAHPRNSFDVHPFSLDLRTEYFDRAESFGIELDPDELATSDFLLSAERWRNSRGMGPATVARLLADYERELASAYPVHRQYPAQLWPPFEEYAVLYGDRYERRPFGFRYRLPEAGDPAPFRLVLPDGVKMQRVFGGWLVRSLASQTVVSDAMMRFITTDRSPQAVDPLLDELAGERPEPLERVRAQIDGLLAAGALWLVPAAVETAVTSRC